MTRRETRKYVINVLRVREHKRQVAKEATDRIAAQFAARYARAVINPNYIARVTITP